MKQQVKCCYGISSKVEKNGHVIMFDFDGVSYDHVVNYLDNVMKKYDFSDFYIIKSEHGYNAICLDIIPLSLIYSIGIAIKSPADRNFFIYGFKRDYLVLRFDNDKALLGVLKNDSRKYEKSMAHKMFLEWFFDIRITDSNFNDITKLDIIQYPSNKNGYHLQDKEIPETWLYYRGDKNFDK